MPITAQTVQVPLDSNDIFEVLAPVANYSVRSTVEVKYKIFDNNQISFPVRIEILDPTCKIKQRTILNSSQPSKGQVQVVGWNTLGSYSDGAALGDGAYCFSVCADYKNVGTPYTICNRRRVSIRNFANQIPVITSTPNAKITKGQNYSYDIRAVDPDGDSLARVITKKPDFLKLNGNKLEGTNIQNLGLHEIVIEVRDNYNGFARQTYKLTVADVATPVAPAPTPEPLPTGGFSYPKADSLLTGEQNLIQWSLTNIENIAELTLRYREVGTNDWKVLTTIASDKLETQKSYNWNVKDLKPGNYELQLQIKDKAGNTSEVVSGRFRVEAKDSGVNSLTEITISDFSPANGSAVKELRPIVGLKITTGSFGLLSLANLRLSINGQDRTEECELITNREGAEYSLRCGWRSDLPVGQIKAKLTITNSSAETVDREWSFAIVQPDSTSEGQVNILGLVLERQTAIILGVIILLLLCLLILPILLLSVWRRRVQTYRTTTTTSTDGQQLTGMSAAGISDPFANYAVNDYASTSYATGDFSIKDSFSASPVESNYNAVTTATQSPVQTPSQSPLQPAVQQSAKPEAEKNIFNKLADKVKSFAQPTQTTTTTERSVTTEFDGPLAPAIQPVVATAFSGSAASMLSDDFNLADTNANDNPVAPTSINPDYQASTNLPQSDSLSLSQQYSASELPRPEAPAPAVNQQTASVPQTAQATQTTVSDESDLPEWLRTDNSPEATTARAATAKEEKDKKGTDPDGDGDSDPADPYGFGDYSLGSPSDK